MGIGCRRFIVDDEGRLVRLRNAIFERLLRDPQHHTMPALAGQRVRMAEILVQLADHRPIQVLLSAGRQTHLRAISRLRDGGLERAGWNAEEGEKLALQLGQLQVEELDGAAVLEQMVALGQAEQAQHLLGGGVRALALLGVDG